MSAKVETCTKGTNDFRINNDQLIDYQHLVNGYAFLRRYRNEMYEDGIKDLPLRSCLKHHNSDRFLDLKVKTNPKWFTELLVNKVDVNTGEIASSAIYRTNEFKQSNSRKINAIDEFCDYFQPLYAKRKVSMLFYTLTMAESGRPIADVINALKKRFMRKGTPILGYVWISEVSADLHWHYHIAVAIQRIDVIGKGLPAYFKLDDLWHNRTQVQFVKKNIRHYMAKYFAKNNYKMLAIDLNGQPKIIRVYGKSVPKN